LYQRKLMFTNNAFNNYMHLVQRRPASEGKRVRGFTLLELLIVIAVIAILSVVLVLVLNPAETLKKSRDAQRISDLNTLKTALGIYTTSTSSPLLAGAANTACKTGTGGGTYASGDLVYYSYPSDAPGAAITDATLDGGTTFPAKNQVANATLGAIDGTGWIPVNLETLTSGSPISNLPIDPTNSIASLSAVAATDLVYRYGCNATSLTFEIDARLESTEYTSTDNRMTKDGGDNSNLYEAGTNLKILGTGSDF
jgi:prepilin-type N-terminal cleavage/methylation domain-containing protein